MHMHYVRMHMHYARMHMHFHLLAVYFLCAAFDQASVWVCDRMHMHSWSENLIMWIMHMHSSVVLSVKWGFLCKMHMHSMIMCGVYPDAFCTFLPKMHMN